MGDHPSGYVNFIIRMIQIFIETGLTAHYQQGRCQRSLDSTPPADSISAEEMLSSSSKSLLMIKTASQSLTITITHMTSRMWATVSQEQQFETAMNCVLLEDWNGKSRKQ
jgi:hypothetical protein